MHLVPVCDSIRPNIKGPLAAPATTPKMPTFPWVESGVTPCQECRQLIARTPLPGGPHMPHRDRTTSGIDPALAGAAADVPKTSVTGPNAKRNGQNGILSPWASPRSAPRPLPGSAVHASPGRTGTALMTAGNGPGGCWAAVTCSAAMSRRYSSTPAVGRRWPRGCRCTPGVADGSRCWRRAVGPPPSTGPRPRPPPARGAHGCECRFARGANLGHRPSPAPGRASARRFVGDPAGGTADRRRRHHEGMLSRPAPMPMPRRSVRRRGTGRGSGGRPCRRPG